MDAGGPGHSENLAWDNVALAFSFVTFGAVASYILELGIGTSLVTAAIRCIVQLTLVGAILQRVFEADNFWAVASIVFLLNFLGTIEAVVNKSKRRYHYMFPIVLLGMIGSTIPISIIGIRFAMVVKPFWSPDQYIPIVGMLCGGTISGIVVASSYVLKEVYENRDKIETHLTFGASRFEACKPVAIEALRLALTPVINQMSVIGIIAIPGMMTGAILGGSSVIQAARLQMIIMFMISSSVTLGVIVTTVLALSVVVDGEERVRLDRIDVRPHVIWRGRDLMVAHVVKAVKCGWRKMKGVLTLKGGRGRGVREKRYGGDEYDHQNGESGVLLGFISESR